MGRAPCCDKEKVKRGPWSPEEDEKLKEPNIKHGDFSDQEDRIICSLYATIGSSCSSSDGSWSNNNHQISQDKEYGYGESLGLQSFGYNNGVGENQQAVNNGGNPLDYSSLEEIKQLISTNNNVSQQNSFFVEENKYEEKVMMYY
nr:transcription factor RAX2-like [Ipomoea batatas]